MAIFTIDVADAFKSRLHVIVALGSASYYSTSTTTQVIAISGVLSTIWLGHHMHCAHVYLLATNKSQYITKRRRQAHTANMFPTSPLRRHFLPSPVPTAPPKPLQSSI